MRRYARGLVAALEEEKLAAAPADTAPAPVEAPAEIVDHSDTVETGLMEVADSEADAAQVEEQTSEAVEVATALESLAVTLHSAADNGGLSKDGAAAVGIAVEHLCARVGLPMSKKGMPALESYGTAQSRVAATQLAMEEIKEKAKQIWEAIIQALKNAITWLVERWQLFFNTAGKLKERANEMAASAAKVSGEAKEKELDKSGLVSALHVGGKVDNVIGTMERIGAIAANVYESAAKRVKTLEEVVASDSTAKVDTIFAVQGEGGVKYNLIDNPENEGLPKPAAGKRMVRGEEMPGGKAVFRIEPEAKAGATTLTPDDIAKMFSGTSVHIGDHSPKVKPADGTKLATLSPADGEKLAKVVASMAEVLEKFQAEVKTVTEAKKKVLAKAEELAKKEGNDDAAKESRAIASIVSSTSRLVDNPIAGMSSYMLGTGKNALDYVALSLKQYGAKEEPKGDAKPAAEPVAA